MKTFKINWGYSLVVERVFSAQEALRSVPSTKEVN